ncbi:superoxide dismutase [Candidatus Woesebacteria bacterium RIFCSPHIGHO2_01_FULL_38_9]|uniref:Superoxide dismutase n=2 Tax=Candidatus Woeseibacteriota TaxID=1752722 RepID=A0A1F7XYW1_9BACT|nr:MAG: superoxide dismutase [Candidatus Woesebacteria bacterium RIFCSPHIGHO2_01_FULL_38_9]OGM59426.1 MAG: superoxide dismutase [Candidatus Woesebacteria bacterium RIFCSPLOWO2_01_FULL_39_10]
MSYQLPKLPYSYDALEPYIDKVTMEIHHTKHHQAYIDNLNKALSSYPKLEKLEVEELLKKIDSVPTEIKQAVINHGGGHANHSFFWKVLRPSEASGEGGMSPSGQLLQALDKTFGSFDKFKEEFTQKALSVFGSGWAFLIFTKEGELKLKRHSFQNSPLMHGNVPILGLDVWEHAYYLKYQNRRAEYVEAWWHVINWKQVESNYLKALK